MVEPPSIPGLQHIRSVPGLAERLRDLAIAIIDRDRPRIERLPDCTPFWDLDQMLSALDEYGLRFVQPPSDFLDFCTCDEVDDWAEIAVPFWTLDERPSEVVLRVQIDFGRPVPHLWIRTHLIP